MLSGPRQLASAEVAYSYFLHDYLKDPSHRSTNRWHGKGARLLRLPGRVGKRVFTAILSGHVPGTDIRLGRVLAGEHQHRPGWDLTFSAPKSVSLEALLHGKRRVMRAHDRAVRETLDWIEVEFLQTRGYDPETGKRPREAAAGMLAATFRHVTSRNEDPQLHTHVVLANMTRSQSGDWRSVEPTLIMRNRRLIGAWYRNALARILGEAGYNLVPTTIGGLPGFELAGYSQAHLDAFSTRRQDILRYMAEKGMADTSDNAQLANLATRGGKIKTRIGKLVGDWRGKARALGLARDPALLRRCKAARKLERSPPRFSALEAAWQALEHLEERHAVFRPQELLATALGRDPGRHDHVELEAAITRLEADGHLVRTKAGDYTTRRALRAEKEVVSLMRAGRGKAGPLVEAAPAEAHLAGAALTDGQRDAARHILLAEDAVIGVQGFAGTGKTRMLNEITRLAGAERVFGLAPSSAAARVLGMEAGIGATTLQYLLARYGAIAEGTATEAEIEAAREQFAGAVMIVDESSMVGTVQMQALLRVSKALGLGRLVLVGDSMQLKAVSAGQPFRLLQKAGMATARMDDILRQRSADLKGAVAHMVAGDPELAMASLGGDVRELPPDALGKAAARLWLALPEEARAKTAILAPTHALREEINAVIREGLADEGVLRGKPLEIMRLVDRRLTRPLAADVASYREGDVVIANRDVYGLGEGEAWTVTGAGPGRVGLARKGQEGGFRPSGNAAGNVSVCETRPISLMAGDEIVFTRNLKRQRIINGERARIEAIDRGRVRIRLASGRGLSFGVDDDDLGHVDHAWSSTVHRAQGMTRDNVIAVLDASSMMSDRAMLYVEMSRARDGFVLLTDDVEQLAHRLEAEGEIPHSALEETGEESWLTPGPGEEAGGRGPLCPAADDWRALAEDAEAARRSVWEMEGYGELMGRIRRRSQAVPEMPAELVRALADHDRRAADRERVSDWVRLTTSASQGRTRLLNAARATSSALQELDGHARWREEAARAVDEGKEMLAGGRRWRQHMDGAEQLEERMGELARALHTDEQAGALLAACADGGMDEALAAEIADAASKAQPGEMPPALAAARARWLEDQRQERLAGKCVAHLDALAAEHQEMWAGSDGPVAEHPRYAGWLRRLGEVLGQAPGLPAGEFRDAVDGAVKKARQQIELDQDVARLHARRRHLLGRAGGEGRPFFRMAEHAGWTKDAREAVAEAGGVERGGIGELKRALGFDREAAAIQDGMQRGEPAGELARRIRKLKRAARPGEMPPGQLQFRRNHRLLAIAGTCRSRLEAGLAARLKRLAGEGGAAVPAELSDWHTGAGLALARLEAVEPGAGKSELAGRVRDAMAGDERAATVWTGWQALEEAARQEGRDRASMPGHAVLMRQIGGLEECPAVLDGVLKEHEAWQAARLQCEDCLARLAALAAEHQEMRADSEGPVAGQADYAGWRQRVDAVLADLEAVELPAGEFREAAATAAKEARQQVQLDQDVAALHVRWHAHAADTERAGMHPFSAEGAKALIDEISQTPADALPTAMQELPARFDEFQEDRDRVAKVTDTVLGLAGRRQALVARAIAAGLAPADTAVHDEWAKDGERAAVAARTILADPARYVIHIDDARQAELRAALDGFGRDRDFDRRAGQLSKRLAGGAAGEEVLAEAKVLKGEARMGELPPVLAEVLAGHKAREAEKSQFEDYLAGLEALAAERRGLIAGSGGPVAMHADYADWRQRLDEALRQEPELLAGEFGFRVAVVSNEIRWLTRLDQDVVRLHDVWHAHQARAKEDGVHPFSAEGGAPIIGDISKTQADALPTAMRELPGKFDEFRVDRDRVSGVIDAASGLARDRETLLELACAEELAPADVAGHDEWAAAGERAAAEFQKLFADPARYGPHLDDARQAELRKALDGFARDLEFDRRAGRLAQKLAGGAAGEEVLAGIRELKTDARAGELSPLLVDALALHQARERAEAAEAILKELMGELGRMKERSALPIARTEEWSRWREQVDEELYHLAAGLPDDAEDPFGAAIRAAIERDEVSARVWLDWRALENKAGQEDRDPASMPGHAELMTRIAGLGEECSADLAAVLAGHEARQAAAQEQEKEIAGRLGEAGDYRGPPCPMHLESLTICLDRLDLRRLDMDESRDAALTCEAADASPRLFGWLRDVASLTMMPLRLSVSVRERLTSWAADRGVQFSQPAARDGWSPPALRAPPDPQIEAARRDVGRHRKAEATRQAEREALHRRMKGPHERTGRARDELAGLSVFARRQRRGVKATIRAAEEELAGLQTELDNLPALPAPPDRETRRLASMYTSAERRRNAAERRRNAAEARVAQMTADGLFFHRRREPATRLPWDDPPDRPMLFVVSSSDHVPDEGSLMRRWNHVALQDPAAGPEGLKALRSCWPDFDMVPAAELRQVWPSDIPALDAERAAAEFEDWGPAGERRRQAAKRETGTRSWIVHRAKPRDFGICCLEDIDAGPPGLGLGLGLELHTRFTTYRDVQELMALGHLSKIRDGVATRLDDAGHASAACPLEFRSLEEHWQEALNAGCERFYVRDDDQWWLAHEFPDGSPAALRPLSEVIAEAWREAEDSEVRAARPVKKDDPTWQAAGDKDNDRGSSFDM